MHQPRLNQKAFCGTGGGLSVMGTASSTPQPGRPTHQGVQEVVAGDGLRVIQGLRYGFAPCHVSPQLGTWKGGTHRTC